MQIFLLEDIALLLAFHAALCVLRYVT